jgi:polyisoprenoid-binding protein YceI
MKSIILIFLTSATALFAQQTQETVLELDPAQTHVQFTLRDILHTVQGSFKLKRGVVHYDFTTGKSSGEIAIDARSGNSGSEARDQRMQKNILESDRYPEIVFIPDHVEGSLAEAKIHGLFRIHGADHEMTLVIKAVPNENRLNVRTQFIVPYVDWGMKNPSTLFLRVGDKVHIEVDALGRLVPAAAGAVAVGQKPAQASSR